MKAVDSIYDDMGMTYWLEKAGAEMAALDNMEGPACISHSRGLFP